MGALGCASSAFSGHAIAGLTTIPPKCSTGECTDGEHVACMSSNSPEPKPDPDVWEIGVQGGVNSPLVKGDDVAEGL